MTTNPSNIIRSAGYRLLRGDDIIDANDRFSSTCKPGYSPGEGRWCEPALSTFSPEAIVRTGRKASEARHEWRKCYGTTVYIVRKVTRAEARQGGAK